MTLNMDRLVKFQHFFVGLFLFSLLVSMAGIEISSGLILLALFAGWGQRVLKNTDSARPLFPTPIGLDWPILFLVIVATVGLIYHNDYNPNRIKEYTPLRWVFLLYSLTYTFHWIGIKKEPVWMERFFLLTVAIGLYAFYQANSGVDLIRGHNNSVQFDSWEKFPYFRASGFFSNPMTYGHSSAMWAALVFGFCLTFVKEKKFFLLSALSLFSILLGLYACHTRGSWIAVLFGLMTVAFVKNVRAGIIFVLATLIGGGILALMVPPFAERIGSIFDLKMTSNVSRLYIWKTHYAIFQDHFWLGSGMNYNPYLLDEYYAKLDIHPYYRQVGHAHNTYLQWLAGTGVLGFAAYMWFILQSLVLTIREYFKTDKARTYIRAVLLGSLGGQMAFHFGGLTECNFRDAEVKSFFLTLIAVSLAIRLSRKSVEAGK